MICKFISWPFFGKNMSNSTPSNSSYFSVCNVVAPGLRDGASCEMLPRGLVPHCYSTNLLITQLAIASTSFPLFWICRFFLGGGIFFPFSGKYFWVLVHTKSQFLCPRDLKISFCLFSPRSYTSIQSVL